MDTIKAIAQWAEFIGFALAIWNGVKLLFTMSANAGTRLSKKAGTANASTDGAIEYTNRAMKRHIRRVVMFGIIGLVSMLILYFGK